MNRSHARLIGGAIGASVIAPLGIVIGLLIGSATYHPAPKKAGDGVVDFLLCGIFGHMIDEVGHTLMAAVVGGLVGVVAGAVVGFLVGPRVFRPRTQSVPGSLPPPYPAEAVKDLTAVLPAPRPPVPTPAASQEEVERLRAEVRDLQQKLAFKPPSDAGA